MTKRRVKTTYSRPANYCPVCGELVYAPGWKYCTEDNEPCGSYWDLPADADFEDV
jgi:hypothetical protein